MVLFGMNDYLKMSKVLAYITQHGYKQPSLEELATIAGISPYHFQRKFINWVGISPKSYLQCMTLNNAKSIMQQGKSVLDATMDSGLSSPGRLHDLCIKLDAATPGEIKNGGMGLHINYGYALTPFGECLIANSPRGICYLAFTESENRQHAFNELKQLWPAAIFNTEKNKISRLVEDIFNSNRGNKKLSLRGYVSATRFQIQVWRALIKIPEGKVVSYGDLAIKINQASAARAVGNAVAANSLAYLIPCHRVIRNTGVIGNYRWGQQRKKALITFETARYKTDSLN
jgi:AraC family transcriptional regulator of adaptative response/methylated-DNA-[protein]-cysteine methyltransferase